MIWHPRLRSRWTRAVAASRRAALRIERLLLVSENDNSACMRAGEDDGLLAALLAATYEERGRIGYSIPIDAVSRETATAEILEACDGWPCVLARTARGYYVLVGRQAIHACGNCAQALGEEMLRAARMSALTLR